MILFFNLIMNEINMEELNKIWLPTSSDVYITYLCSPACSCDESQWWFEAFGQSDPDPARVWHLFWDEIQETANLSTQERLHRGKPRFVETIWYDNKCIFQLA